MAGDRLVHDVLKKLPAAVAPFEGGPFNDLLDMLLKKGNILFGLSNFGELCCSCINLMCLSHSKFGAKAILTSIFMERLRGSGSSVIRAIRKYLPLARAFSCKSSSFNCTRVRYSRP